MQFLFRQPSMPKPGELLPGRPEPIVDPGAALRERPRPHAPLPRRLRDRRRRHGLLLGRREEVLVHPRRLGHGRGLPGRRHAEPDLPGGLHRANRARRGGADRVRPRRSSPTSGCSRRSGSPTTRRRGSARATTRAPSTAPRSSPTARPSSRRPRRHATCTRRSWRARATGRSRPRSARPPSSTSPRTTTSSTWPRTRTATTATRRRASRARSGWGCLPGPSQGPHLATLFSRAPRWAGTPCRDPCRRTCRPRQ